MDLAATEILGDGGGFRYFVHDDRWEWSDELARMHGYRPGTVTPTTDLVLAHRHPDDNATVADLILQVYRQAPPSPFETGLSMPAARSDRSFGG